MALIVSFGADATYQLPSRQRDVLIWTRLEIILSATVKVVDMWQLRDGDTVLLTNRPSDFPLWFQLHPTEVSGAASFEMAKKLEAGWQPSPIVDGPNVWKVLAGDRVAWLGESRPPYETDQGLLAVFDFSENAIVLGWLPGGELLDWMGFGSLPETWQEEEEVAARVALRVIHQLGVPRTIAEHWSIP